jgi:hypothetical protein
MDREFLPTPRRLDRTLLRSVPKRKTFVSVNLLVALVLGASLVLSLLVGVYQLVLPVGNDEPEFIDQVYGSTVDRREHVAESYKIYDAWLTRNGSEWELSLFRSGSLVLLALSDWLSVTEPNIGPSEPSVLNSVSVALCAGVMRILFVFSAMLRPLAIFVVGFVIYSAYRFRVYTARDLLGQTGNGRMFFSGIQVGLQNTTKRGAPCQHVRGLACLKGRSRSEVQKSDLWRVVTKFDAANETNERLVGFLLNYDTTPAYVARSDEKALLAQAVAPVGIAENARHLLSAVLSLHSTFQNSDPYIAPSEGKFEDNASLLPHQYFEKLKAALHEVISEVERKLVGQLPASELATLVLAVECGKIMAYAFEGGQWICTSNYIQLNASPSDLVDPSTFSRARLKV